jgi:hypothetical protein
MPHAYSGRPWHDCGMSGEMWVVIGVFALVGAIMVARPETFAFWRIHRTPEALAASRGVGALLLVAIAVGLFVRCAESVPEPPAPSRASPPATRAPEQGDP